MLHSIAVTTDFSQASREAFAPAAALARRFAARLHLVHFVQTRRWRKPWDFTPPSPRELSIELTSLRRRLDKMAASEPLFSGLKPATVVMQGDWPGVWERFEHQENIDLILTATHGHWNAKQFQLGSFAARLLNCASRPLLVFRPPAAIPSEEGRPFHPRRILVPYDFSIVSRAAISTARLWASAFGAKAQLLFVVEQPPDPRDYPLERDRGSQLGAEDIPGEALQRLQELAKREWEGVPFSVRVRSGHPSQEILREAEEFAADLIIMAGHGASSLDRNLLGSVAGRTVRLSPCPVLVLKPRLGAEPAARAETKQGAGQHWYDATSLLDYLNRRHIPFCVGLHSPTATALETASALHVSGKRFAKTVVAMGPSGAMLAILPAHLQIDLKKLERLSGQKPLRLATEEEFSGFFPDCEAGAMPPFGHLYGLAVYLDDDIALAPEVTFNACSHEHALTISGKDFLKAAEAVVGDCSNVRRPSAPPSRRTSRYPKAKRTKERLDS